MRMLEYQTLFFPVVYTDRSFSEIQPQDSPI